MLWKSQEVKISPSWATPGFSVKHWAFGTANKPNFVSDSEVYKRGKYISSKTVVSFDQKPHWHTGRSLPCSPLEESWSFPFFSWTVSVWEGGFMNILKNWALFHGLLAFFWLVPPWPLSTFPTYNSMASPMANPTYNLSRETVLSLSWLGGSPATENAFLS